MQKVILRNNAADIEDFDVSDIGSDSNKDEEESISLGFEDSDYEDYAAIPNPNKSFELDPDADTLIKPKLEHFNLFEGGGYGKGKPLNNSFTGPYNNMEHIHVDRGANKQFN